MNGLHDPTKCDKNQEDGTLFQKKCFWPAWSFFQRSWKFILLYEAICYLSILIDVPEAKREPYSQKANNLVGQIESNINNE